MSNFCIFFFLEPFPLDLCTDVMSLNFPHDHIYWAVLKETEVYLRRLSSRIKNSIRAKLSSDDDGHRILTRGSSCWCDAPSPFLNKLHQTVTRFLFITFKISYISPWMDYTREVHASCSLLVAENDKTFTVKSFLFFSCHIEFLCLLSLELFPLHWSHDFSLNLSAY